MSDESLHEIMEQVLAQPLYVPQWQRDALTRYVRTTDNTRPSLPEYQVVSAGHLDQMVDHIRHLEQMILNLEATVRCQMDEIERMRTAVEKGPATRDEIDELKTMYAELDDRVNWLET